MTASLRGGDALHLKTEPRKGPVDHLFFLAVRAHKHRCSGDVESGRALGRFPGGGELNGEEASLARPAVYIQFSTQKIHDFPADGQAQAGATILPCGGAVGLAEGFKKAAGISMGKLAEIDADPCVFDVCFEGDAFRIFVHHTAGEGNAS